MIKMSDFQMKDLIVATFKAIAILAGLMASELALSRGAAGIDTSQLNPLNPLNLPNLGGSPFRRGQTATGDALSLGEDLLLTEDHPLVPGDSNLQWPAPPRDLYRPFDARIETKEFAFGLSGYVPNVPLPISTSLSFQRVKKYEEVVQVGLAMWVKGNPTDLLEEKEYVKGYTANHIREGQLVVGACELQVAVYREKTFQLGGFFAGNGGAHRKSDQVGSPIIRMSHFFQVRSDIPLFVYHDACADWFDGEVKTDASEQAVQIVREMEKRRAVEGQCQPNFPGAPIRAAGDRQCEAWFEQRIPSHLREKAVPRCVYQGELDSYVCVAKYREEGQSCPLFKGESGITTTRTSLEDILIAPRGMRSTFECDEQANLKCEIVKSPEGFRWGPVCVRK